MAEIKQAVNAISTRQRDATSTTLISLLQHALEPIKEEILAKSRTRDEALIRRIDAMVDRISSEMRFLPGPPPILPQKMIHSNQMVAQKVHLGRP